MSAEYKLESGDEIVLDAAILRRIAEAASGIRGKDLYFVVTRTRNDPWSDLAFEIVDENPGRVSGAVVIKCRTENPTPPKPVTEVWVSTASGGVSPNLAQIADAVFWSESALQKFAVPYYASVGGDLADFKITDLLSTFEQADVAALVHLPKSDYGVAGMETDASRMRRGSLEDFFGVIPNEPQVERTTRVVPLSEFLMNARR